MGGIKTISIIVAANIKGLEAGLGKASKSLKGFASGAARMGSLLSFGVTAPLAALGKQAFDTFSQFENSMMKVNTITGATTTEFATLTAEAKRLGATTQYTAQQVANLQLVLGRKGFDPTQIKNMEQSILDLALATGEDLNLAAETVSSSINAFGFDASQAGEVANTLASAAANSSIQLSSFSTAFGHAGTAAQSVGVEFNELAAMMGVLMDNGIKASKAGTGLRKIFIELAQKGKNLTEGLDEMARGNSDIIDTSDAVGKTAAAQLKILLDNRQATKDLSNEYKNNTGRLKDMAKAMGGTTFAKVKKMESAIEGLRLEIGALLAETITPIILRITDLAGGFTGLDSSTQKLILTFAGIMAAMGPILIGFAALVSLVNPIALGVLAVAAALTALSVATSENISQIERENTALNNLAERAMGANEGSEKRIELIKELQTEYPGFLENMDAEKIANEDIRKALDQSNTSFLKKLQLQAESEKLQKLMNDKAERGRDLIDKENESLETLRDLYKDSGKELLDTLPTKVKLSRALEDMEGKYIKLDHKTRQWIGTLGDKSGISERTRGEVQDLSQELESSQTAFDDASTAVDDYLEHLNEIGSTTGQVETPTPTKTPKVEPTGGEKPKLWWEGGKFEAGFNKAYGKISGFLGELDVRGKTLGENMVTGITAGLEGLTQALDTAFQIAEKKDQETFDRKKDQLEATAEFESMTAEQQSDALAKLEEDSFKRSKAIAKKKAKAEKAMALFNAIVSVASQVAANVAVPPLAVAIAAAGAVQVASIAAAPLPQFADGGIVSGPTMGLMGEYAGARSNPEVIAPLDKLRSLMGNQNIDVNVTGHLDAEGIQIAAVRGNEMAQQKGGRSFSASF